MVKGPRKYIVIPEYRPLYAMQECYGPTHGPLKQPCLTPLAVIRKLLMQTGNESLTVMEVVKDEKTGKYSEPVRLTLDNYMLPYDEIKNGKKVPTSEARVIMSKDRPIQPKKAKFNPNPDLGKKEVAPVVEAPAAPAVEEADPTHKVVDLEDTVHVESSVDAVSDDSSIDYEKEIPGYSTMTKAQRKAARRALREAEAEKTANNVLVVENGNDTTVMGDVLADVTADAATEGAPTV